MSTSVCDIEKLAELFQSVCKEDQLDDEDDSSKDAQPDTNDTIQCTSNQNVSDRNKSTKGKKVSPYAKIDPPKRREVLDPDNDSAEELYFDETFEDAGKKDWKNIPKWDISYSQNVTASDVFLGMGFKNPSTSSCENMIVTVELPGENRPNIDLKIEKEKLIVNSPKFFLDLKLPHCVDPKRGNAQFDREGEKLVINLVMDRELDLLNF